MTEFTKINDTTYKTDFPERDCDVVLGGSDPTKFVPNINLSFKAFSGQEQYWVNINRKSVVVSSEKESLVDGQLKLTVGDNSDVLKSSDTDKTRELEWDIELPKKPPTNVFDWDIQFAKGVSFYYQPAMTPEETAMGLEREDYVVGSYAVYCDRANSLIRDGELQYDYGCGKLCHIFRPVCIDANKKEVFAELFIDPKINLLRITIPQDFLDNAKYPVVLDPYFGITGEGVTNWTTVGYSLASYATTTTEAGAITKVRAYCYNGSATQYHIKICVFDDGTNKPGNKVGTQCIVTLPSYDNNAYWLECDTSGGTLAAETKYWFAANIENGSGRIRYDAVAVGNYKTSIAYADAFSDPWGGDTTARTVKLSVACEYTESGGGGASIPIIMHHRRQRRRR